MNFMIDLNEKELCQNCGKPFNVFTELIWADRALTVCYCEDCYKILYPDDVFFDEKEEL